MDEKGCLPWVMFTDIDGRLEQNLCKRDSEKKKEVNREFLGCKAVGGRTVYA